MVNILSMHFIISVIPSKYRGTNYFFFLNVIITEWKAYTCFKSKNILYLYIHFHDMYLLSRKNHFLTYKLLDRVYQYEYKIIYFNLIMRSQVIDNNKTDGLKISTCFFKYRLKFKLLSI